MSGRIEIGRIVGRTIDLVSDHFTILFPVSLISAATGLALVVPEPDVEAATSFSELMPVFGYAGFMIVFGLVALFLSLLVMSALFYASDDAASGIRPTVGSAFSRAARVYWRALGATLLAGLIMGGAFMAATFVSAFGFVFSAVPGLEVLGLVAFLVLFLVTTAIATIYVFGPLTMILPGIVLFERTPVTDSIERSFALARGQRVRLAVISSIAYGVLSIPGFAWALGVDLYITSLDPGFLVRFLLQLVAVFIAAAVTPVFVAAVYFTYRDVVPPAEPEAELATV